MNRIGIPESEQPALLAYLKRTYRYEDGGVVNRRTGRRVQGSKMRNGYLGFTIHFNGNTYCTLTQRIVWALCYNELPTKTVDHINQRIVWALCNNELPSQTVDHINGDRLDNRIENLREVSQSDNNLNTLLAWEPNKDTGVTGVAVKEHGYQSKIQGRNFHFHNPYEAFYWAIACGKRYRA